MVYLYAISFPEGEQGVHRYWHHSKPKESHLKAVKRIFRYLKGTVNLGLWYPKGSSYELTGYTDADHGGCKLDRKSTTGHIQFLGDKLVSWASKKQNCVSLSTAEAEYVAAASCCSQIIWMRTQLRDYGFKFDKIPIYCDSKSAIAISCNPVQHTKTKHIDIRKHISRGVRLLNFYGLPAPVALPKKLSLREMRGEGSQSKSGRDNSSGWVILIVLERKNGI
ncbi:hypothetical protein OSB04_un001231 [Centaurea solstitialis]|uniref:Copia protein n=1 Tax=Centaurea solstitialis TaxID=347529 RepID=A0AA38W1W2_9ASTR|nr:hypothetical protein OSB04_un001231 [Centaurea solstitialis]